MDSGYSFTNRSNLGFQKFERQTGKTRCSFGLSVHDVDVRRPHGCTQLADEGGARFPPACCTYRRAGNFFAVRLELRRSI